MNKEMLELQRLRGEVTMLRRDLATATNKPAAAPEQPQDRERNESIAQVVIEARVVVSLVALMRETGCQTYMHLSCLPAPQ